MNGGNPGQAIKADAGESPSGIRPCTLIQNSSKRVRAGESRLDYDSYTGLPKLPVVPVESEEELGETTPTVALWHYSSRSGLTEIMSNSMSGGGSSKRKSVTFEEQILPPEVARHYGRMEKSAGSEQVSFDYTSYVASYLLLVLV